MPAVWGRYPGLGSPSKLLVKLLPSAVSRGWNLELPRFLPRHGQQPSRNLRQWLPLASQRRVDHGGCGRVEVAELPRLGL